MPGRAHPAAEQRVNAVHRRREKGAGGLALALGEERKFAATGDDAVGLQ